MSEITTWRPTPSRPVIVRSARSRYDGYRGFVVAPDEEGGFEVALPCAALLLHFEPSELEFLGSPQIERINNITNGGN